MENCVNHPILQYTLKIFLTTLGWLGPIAVPGLETFGRRLPDLIIYLAVFLAALYCRRDEDEVDACSVFGGWTLLP